MVCILINMALSNLTLEIKIIVLKDESRGMHVLQSDNAKSCWAKAQLGGEC
jgi:hypothetical protein